MNVRRLLLTAPAAFFFVAVESFAFDWRHENGVRSASIVPIGSGKVGFTSMTPEQTGLRFTNILGEERGLTNQIYYSSSGVAAADIDDDGLADLYFCNLEGRNALYRNLGGWKFAEITEPAGVVCPGQASTGAVFADVDGNGHLDLLVSSLGRGVRLFINDGRGHFTESTKAGLQSDRASMTMTLADVDGDGDLDLYVANYRKETFQDEANVRFRLRTTNGAVEVIAVNGRPATAADLTNRYYVDAQGAIQENGEADALYLNDGRGNFSAVSWTGGAFLDESGAPLNAAPLDWGLSAMFRDMNGDGAPDLYVCNDGPSPDRIWLNDGRGHFRAISARALRETSFSSMGIDFADINRDGFDDFFVADMLGYTHRTLHTQMPTRIPRSRVGEIQARASVPRNTLFLNRGDNTYAEIAQFSGLEASEWSWCPVFLDVDLDGYEDLLITTGLEKNLRDADGRSAIESLRRQNRLTQQEFLALRRRLGPLRTPNFAFRNRGDRTFENVSASWGFDSMHSSHGMALGDLDNDGDLDVIVSCLNAPPLVYRNDSPAPRIAVRLKGSAKNARGIGARVEVSGGPFAQMQEMICGGRYLSCDDPMRVFACGVATNLTLTVRWRSGAASVLSNALPNRIYEFSDAGSVPNSKRVTAVKPSPMFADASLSLRHRHFESDFDDFLHQPTLTKRLSTVGPGVAWCDLDGDGRDEVIFGSGHRGQVATFRNAGGRFERLSTSLVKTPSPADISGIVAWPLGPGSNALLMALSNYETRQTNALLLVEVAGGVSRQVTQGAAWNSVVNGLALADLDGDGKLEIFAAGRVIPGRYPEAASSRIYRINGNLLELDPAASSAFAGVGLVNGVVFTDIDGDGRAELVLSCEWDSLRVFRFEKDRFVEITAALKLDRCKGWWQGVTAGDFDGDGRMDIVAANWGRNHHYARFAAEPVQIFFADVNGDGVIEMLEAYYAADLKKPVPSRHWDTVAYNIPAVQQRVRSFSQFSELGVTEISGSIASTFRNRSANTFDSTVFLNRGNHFEPVALPLEAQLAPAFGVCVADFDGDGHEDIFLAQNFFGTDSETSRYDAGRGLLLPGDGAGHFRAIPGQESGVQIYGEGRGAAVCDYDGDGRIDLCVGQNGGETKLYHNERGRPGLRVRLTGAGGNLAAAGAQLRPIYASGKFGPTREIHLGSGWLSQDSTVQVIAESEPIDALWIRWPGGLTTTNKISAGVHSIEANISGPVTAWP